MEKRKWLEYGGIASGVILIAFGIGAVGMSINGYKHGQRQPQGREDHERGDGGHHPDEIAEDAKQAALPSPRSKLPTCSVEGDDIDSAPRARCFAEYMRVHVLESTGGLTYSELGRYASAGRRPQGNERLRRCRDG